jgi:DNA polymerase-1
VSLLEHHQERLETTSALSTDVVSRRGYFSVSSSDELKGRGFPRDIGRFLPAIAIPLFVLGPLEPGERLEPTGLLLRPDRLYTFKDGRTAKYLAPNRQANGLDVHPIARDWLLDAEVPLVVTEGVIKGDAAVSVGFATVGLGGVDGGWRNGAPLPDWELIPLKGRQTLIAVDSDVTVKPSVRGALDRLVGYLQWRGATVEIVVLPPGPHGEKTGLDDFLAANRGSAHPIGLLLERAVAAEAIPDEGEPAPVFLGELTGAEVLDVVDRFIARFVHFSREQERWATDLSTAVTHFVDYFDVVAYLGVRSAVKESGKSRLLEILALLVRYGEYLLEPSDASVFRLLAEEPAPVLLIDELDQTLKSATDRSSLIGLLNAGFVRGATVPRVEETGEGRAVIRLPVFGPKAFASIGRALPDTTASRTIFVDLKRRMRDEPVERWRIRRGRGEAREVRDLLAAWAASTGNEAERIELDHDLEFLSDRAADIWESLLIVAVLAGAPWPERAIEAARLLSNRSHDDDDEGLPLALVRDLRGVFAELGDPEVVKSGDAAKALNTLEDRPWGALRDGRGISTHAIARYLLLFEIRPEQHRDSAGEKVRGWWRTSLQPVWARYVDEDETETETDNARKDTNTPDSPSTPDQTGTTETDAAFRLEQVESAETQTETRDSSCPTLEPADRASGEPFVPVVPVRSQDQGENANRTGRLAVGQQLEADFDGLEQAIELGGGSVEVHRLPPDPTGANRERLQRFLADAARRGATLALDCETTNTDPYDLDVRVWSVSDGVEAWAIDARDPHSSRQLAAELASYPGPLAVHNATFDIPVAIRELGLDADSFTERAHTARLVDTMVLARLCHPDERRIGLKEIAKLEFGAGAGAAEERLKLAFKHLRGNAESKWRAVDPAHPAYWAYAAADAALTARLHARLCPGVDAELLGKEMRVALICLRAGLRGWRVDPDAAVHLERDLATERDRLAATLRRVGVASVTTTAGRNAIVEALRREGHCPDGPSLSREVLEPLVLAGSEVARAVLALRTVSKFLALYVPLFTGVAKRDGRLHPFPLTLATVTGRMSLPGVPLQTAPKGELELAGENGTLTAAIRSALVADDGQVTAGVDFQTMELRIAAALSQDVRLRHTVDEGDAHTAVAARLFSTTTPTRKQRAVAKTVNFGVLYGMGSQGLARRLRIPADEARSFVSRWWDEFPAVRKLRDRLAHEERRSLWGRRLPADVPDHVALNHVIQAYGRDLFAAGLLALEDADLDQHLLLPLHDEYVIQLPADTATATAQEIAALVATRLHEVELPVEANVGARAWSSLSGGGA